MPRGTPLATYRSHPGAPTSTQPSNTPVPADTLVEGYGVRTQVQANSTPYGDRDGLNKHTPMLNAMLALHCRYWRESTIVTTAYWSGGNNTQAANQLAAWSYFAASGIRGITNVGRPESLDGPLSAYANYHKAVFGGDTGGIVWAIEGGNEWNGTGTVGNGKPGVGSGPSVLGNGKTYGAAYPKWAEQLAVQHQAMYPLWRGDAALDGIKIYGPPLVSGNATNGKALRDVANTVLGVTDGLTSVLDYGNYHVYPGQASAAQAGDTVPSALVDTRIAAPQNYAATLPFACTETGMHNALNSSGSGLSATPPNPPDYAFSAHSETAAGVYWPRAVLEHQWRGSVKVVTFELVDDWIGTDTHLTDQETSFGLYRHDWTAKPAATALQRMMTLFDDPGSITLVDCNYTLDLPTTDSRSMLFQRRDGTYLLALWRDVNVYNYVTQSSVTVTAQDATLTFDTSRLVDLYRPTSSATPENRGAVTSLNIPLAGEVVIAKIT